MTEAYPLSAFQRAMLSWDRLYPYNAVHAVQLSGPADAAALNAAILAVREAAGLGNFAVDPHGRRFEYEPRRDVVPASEFVTNDPTAKLRERLCAGLQHRFPSDAHDPLIWSIDAAADGDSHLICLAYHHVVADAQAIAALLAEVLRRYAGESGTGAPVALHVKPPRAALALDPPVRALRLFRGIGRTLRTFRRMKLAHKMPDERDGGDVTECVVQSAPDGLHGALSRRCREGGVGFNDALLGAFGAAIAERTPDRHSSRRRRKIALGGIISLRRRAADDVSDYFGVCLRDMLVLLDDPDAGVDAVIQQAAAQTRLRKADAGRAAGAAAMTTFFVDRLWPLLFIPHNRRSYRKLLPLCGGVSPFVVESERFGAAAGRILRYVRACPTGPAAPLLLGPTVYDGTLELSLTHRLACMDHAGASALLSRTLALLADWCQTA